jgi:hypothetical protein
MKLFFSTTIFFFLIINNSDGLLCVDSVDIIDLSKDFTLACFKKKLNSLTVSNKYDKCIVGIDFSQTTKSIEVSFTMSHTSNNLKANREVKYATWIRFPEDEMSGTTINIGTYLKFACNSTDECDRRFVLDHLKWIFEANYNELASAISPLLISKDQYTGKMILNFFYIYTDKFQYKRFIC